MKTILLWDPRFPDRAPVRLALDDAVASAAVRSGVAAPANPAEASALLVGGAIAGPSLVEVVLQHGVNSDKLARVFVPAAVHQAALALGKSAPTGKVATLTGAAAITATPSAFTMTQLAASQRVYQRSTTTDGSQGKGTGTIPVAINATSTGSVYARVRGSDGSVLQPSWVAATLPATGAQNVLIGGVDARLGWFYLDLSGDGVTWQNGTVLVGMGRLVAVRGQSLAANMFKRITDTTTLAAMGLTPNPNGVLFATYANIAATYQPAVSAITWQQPADGGTYDSAFAVEYLNRDIAQYGVNVGMIGHGYGGSSIATWTPGGTNQLTQFLAVCAGAGGAWESDIYDQGHADGLGGVTTDQYRKAVLWHFAACDAANMSALPRSRRIGSIPNTNSATISGVPAQINAVREGARLAAADLGAAFVDPQDIVLNGDGAHPTQQGNVTRARHYYRAALAANDDGPKLLTATRTAAQTLRLVFANPGTALLAIGAWQNRVGVYNAGSTRSVWPVSAATIVNATTVDLTLSADPGAGQALDVYMWMPLKEATNDPSGLILRDDRVDGDGIAAGRGVVVNPTPIQAAAITAGGSTNAPPGGIVAQTSTHDLSLTNATFGAEQLSGFGPAMTAGYGQHPVVGGAFQPYPMTFGCFFVAPAAPSANVALWRLGMAWVGISAALKITGAFPNNASYVGATTLVSGHLYHVAMVLDDTSSRIYLQDITAGTAGAVDFTGAVPFKQLGAQSFLIRQYSAGGGNMFSGTSFHYEVWKSALYTGNSYTAPTAPRAGTEADLVELWRLSADGSDSVRRV